MTIKRRLFISNILMIVIPFIVSVVTVWVSFFVINAVSGGALLATVAAGRDMQVSRRPDPSTQMVFAYVLMFVLFLVILFLTNRFLTRFVFKRIKQPLEMLSDGVRQISEGNLDHRIAYFEEDEFKPVCEDFNDMAARLKASVEEVQRNEESRKELLAGISHDLLSPLTSIKGFVEGLLDGVADTPQARREYLEIIRQKTDDINHMVSQLFIYSKMDMGNYPIHPEMLDIARELADFVSASREEYRAKGLVVELTCALEGCLVFVDQLQLRSVFANILNNSIKYKEKDAARVAIGATERDSLVSIVFEDDGPGVSEGELEKIFGAFFRSDPSRNNPHEGSGLGLAIAAKAVERMNGKVKAANGEGGGLRLTIEIPQAQGGLPQ
ncbi:MAG: HAMP domain-containing histidine kinase [Eggerthellaceae bacterium]|nr:HAMP domain-containing histidine kinase [Eggerthellaceae bacterium]